MTMGRLAGISLSVSLAGAALALLFQIVRAAPAGQALFAAANGSGSSCMQATPCALQKALDLAANGDTIFVKQGTYTSTKSSVISITLSITLYGGWNGNASGLPIRDPAAYPTTIDGQGHRRGMFVSSGITPTIDGFIIRNGNASGLIDSCSLDAAHGCGGGIFVDQAAARIQHNQFISNTALITTTIFAEGHGGGLYLEWANGAVISANTFLSNSATLPYAQSDGDGGGLAATGYVPDSLVVQNNSFISNSAYWGGGLAFAQASNTHVRGNMFQSNTAYYGGGLYHWYVTGDVLSNTFRGNAGDAPAYLGFYGGLFGANLLTDNATTEGLLVLDDVPSSNVVVYDNIIANNGGAGILASGYFTYPLKLLALNNTVVGPGSGIGLLAPNGFVTITADNNIFSGFDTGVTINHPLSSSVDLFYTLFDSDVGATGSANFSQTVFWGRRLRRPVPPQLSSAVQFGGARQRGSNDCIHGFRRRPAPDWGRGRHRRGRDTVHERRFPARGAALGQPPACAPRPSALDSLLGISPAGSQT